MALHVFVIKETELEDPQDLRAESEKYSNSTNERKNMSTKTLRKRIALVAVSALGAGLLSVVAVPSANAADNVAPGTASPNASATALNIATTANTTGSAVLTATNGAPSSVGLIATSDVAGGRVAGTTQTAIMLATGTLVTYALNSTTDADTNSAIAVTVENGLISGNTNVNGVNAGRTTAVCYDSAAAACVVALTPNAGATTMTVRAYKAALSTYGSAAAAIAAPSLGTLFGQISVTIATSSSAGVVATAKSGVYYAASASATGLTADDTSGTWLTKSPTAQYANILVRDAYGSAIASTTGLLQASATNGGIVSLNANGSAAVGTASTAFYTGATPNNTMLTVVAPTYAPVTTVVTVSYNGVVIGTKTFTFTGPVKTVTLGSAARINDLSHTATSTQKGAGISFADAAGNAVYVGDSYYAASGFLTSASSDRSAILSVAPSTSSTPGYVDWSCDSSATSDNLIVTYVNTDGTIATSNTVKVSCAGNPYTYTASYDKASYAPGEVAVLTVTFKDSKGNLANDITSWSSTLPVVTAGGGSVATAPTTSDASALGVKTYNVVTIVTEGTYQTVVNIPVVKTSNSSQKDVIAGFTLKASSGAVSNADVLKAIVSLIASINKQIAALQKALLKK
jgi:hypothetical protein